VLVRAVKQADETGTQIRLVAGGPALQRVLTVTGVASMFQLFDSLDQAVIAA
jgi:anti-anti-sigma regulatory factor